MFGISGLALIIVRRRSAILVSEWLWLMLPLDSLMPKQPKTAAGGVEAGEYLDLEGALLIPNPPAWQLEDRRFK